MRWGGSPNSGQDSSRRPSLTLITLGSREFGLFCTGSLSIFLCRFPMDLDVRCKATLIGAAFLIDYMFFEKKANNENDGAGMMS